MDFIKPTKEAIEEAKLNPNGWVYVIDRKYEGKKYVPPEGIIGAWKVNDKGIIEGGFIYNSNFKNN